MQVMLKASYKRQARYTGQAPEMISAEYGEIEDRLVLGELASAVQSVAFTRGDMHMAGIINDAINRAAADGKLVLLPERGGRDDDIRLGGAADGGRPAEQEPRRLCCDLPVSQ